MSVESSHLSDLMVNLLKNAKFAHLSTSDPETHQPNVSLMNYVYLCKNEPYNSQQQQQQKQSQPQTQQQNDGDKKDVGNSYILFSVNKNATNFENITKNPKVSVLIHDWVTAKSQSISGASSNEPNVTINTEKAPSHSNDINNDNDGNNGNNSTTDISPLLQLLKSMNQNELSTISVTLNGEAILVKSEEEGNYYRTKLLNDYPDAKIYIEGEQNHIILIKINHYKVVDTQNNVKRY